MVGLNWPVFFVRDHWDNGTKKTGKHETRKIS